MHRRAVVHALAATTLALLAAACGSSDAAAPDAPSTIGGVGALPDTLPGVASTLPPSTDAVTATTVEDSSPDDAPTTSAPGDDSALPVGRLVDGNRVLVIGDSILASISSRYGDQLCDRLVPRGWEVEVDAEVGRFVEFGRQVLERQPVDEWDAAVVMLGNNYRGDPEAFGRELDLLLDELRPLPVLLLTVTRFEAEQDEVNYVLVGEANQRDDVRVLDWAGRTAEDVDDADELLTGDDLHLTAAGQDELAAMIGRGLGRAPSGAEGSCLRSSFRDDSGGSMPSTSDDDRDDGDDRDADTDGDRGGESTGDGNDGRDGGVGGLVDTAPPVTDE